MRYCMDLELWSRLLREGKNVIVPEAMGVYTAHDETKTALMQDVLLEERKQIVDRIRNSEPGLGAVPAVLPRLEGGGPCPPGRPVLPVRKARHPAAGPGRLDRAQARPPSPKRHGAAVMHSRHLSTLHLLGLFAFTALALNDDSFILGVGSFKLSPFDVIFVAILVVKAMRLADRRPTRRAARWACCWASRRCRWPICCWCPSIIPASRPATWRATCASCSIS